MTALIENFLRSAFFIRLKSMPFTISLLITRQNISSGSIYKLLPFNADYVLMMLIISFYTKLL